MSDDSKSGGDSKEDFESDLKHAENKLQKVQVKIIRRESALEKLHRKESLLTASRNGILGQIHWRDRRLEWLPILTSILKGLEVKIPDDYRMWCSYGAGSNIHYVSYGNLKFSIAWRPDGSHPQTFNIECDGKSAPLPRYFLMHLVYAEFPQNASELRSNPVREQKDVLAEARRRIDKYDPQWDFGLLMFHLWVRWDYKGETTVPIWPDITGYPEEEHYCGSD